MWTLLFDIDGTLIRTRGSGLSAIKRAMMDLFGVKALPQVPVHGRTDYGIISDLFAPFEIHVDDNIEAFKQKYFSYLPEALTRCEGEILPGVVALLDELSNRSDVALGLITGNTAQSAEIKLRHFGLWDYFSFGGYGDWYGDRNDVARQALSAAKKKLGSGFDPARLWMVGDTPNDVRCARAIESQIIAVGTGGGSRDELASAEPDVLFDSLACVKSFSSHVFGRVD